MTPAHDPLANDRWRVTLAVLAALAVWAFVPPVLAGIAAVGTGEIAWGGAE
jgi:hypothetical protein